MTGPFKKPGAGSYLPFFTYPPRGLLESPCILGDDAVQIWSATALCFVVTHRDMGVWVRGVLLCSSTAGHFEVHVVDFCQIPCLNGGRCIGRDECWCPSNSTGKFCHLPAPRLDRELAERGSRPRALPEGPLRQSTFTLPLSNQLGECRAGAWGWAPWVAREGGSGHGGGGDRPPGLSSQSDLPPSPPLPSGLHFIPKLLFALPSEFSNVFVLAPYEC